MSNDKPIKWPHDVNSRGMPINKWPQQGPDLRPALNGHYPVLHNMPHTCAICRAAIHETQHGRFDCGCVCIPCANYYTNYPYSRSMR